MSKKKMYGLLAFIIVTFSLLAIVIVRELKLYSQWSSRQNESDIIKSQVVNNTDNTGGIDNKEEGAISSEDADSTTIPNNEDVVIEPTQVPNKDIVMVFGGDVYMSNYVVNKYDKEGINGILSDDLLQEFLESSFSMVNQEFTFSNGGVAADDKQYTFRVDPNYVSIFEDMKVDFVTLANNHSLDFGTDALVDSFTTLKHANIEYVGAGNNLEEAKEVKYKTVNDKKIAVIGASRVIPETSWNANSNKPGLLTTYESTIYSTMVVSQIEEAEMNSDFTIVFVHWGKEKHSEPEEYQRTLAKQYIDAGADLVVGSHPHVLQGIEYYKDKPIIYSLGNFMFYNSINQTALLKVTLDDKNEAKVQLLPCKAENAKTYMVEDTALKDDFYRYMTEISFDITFDDEGTVVR